MLARICGTCGGKAPMGGPCPRCGSRHAAYDRGARDRGRAAFYQSSRWRALKRAAFVRAGGMDEYILACEGRAVPGTVVHHIEPVAERPDLRLDLANVVLVSAATHAMAHAAYARGGAVAERMKAALRSVRAAGGPR